MKPFDRIFYDRPAEEAARAILGKNLVRKLYDWNVTAGRIVETEAYLGPHDLASHSSKKKTRRTAVMLGPPWFCLCLHGLWSLLHV